MRLNPTRACALLAALALSACGSTVQQNGALSGRDVGDAPAGTEEAAFGSPGEAAASAGTGPGTSSAGGKSVRGGAAAAARSGSGQGGGSRGPTSAAPAPGKSGQGFTATEVFIGVAYDSTLSQGLGAVGVSPGEASVGDQREQVTAVVKDINEHGGIAGRKVVPVFYDTRGQNDPNTASQAACAAWTEDHHVFAAMTYVVQIDNGTLFNCLTRHGVVYTPLGPMTSAVLNRYAPYLWVSSDVAIDRFPATWMQRLAAFGYFSGWDNTLGQPASAPAKIGILYGDGARNNAPETDDAFVKAVERALAQQGRSVTERFPITSNSADPNAAVLRFKSKEVTHVIGDFSIALFASAAESQQYRPRYGFSSRSGGIVLALLSPGRQLHGALGVGWRPAGDVDEAQDPGDVGPAEAHCRDVMERSGQPTTSRLAWFAMTITCDTFNFFALAANRGGLSPAGLRQGAEALGSVPPASTFAIAFPSGRPDGAGAVRDIGYRDDCACFAYLSARNHGL